LYISSPQNRQNNIFINNQNCSKLFQLDRLNNLKEKQKFELFSLNLNSELNEEENNLINYYKCENLEIIVEDVDGNKDVYLFKIRFEVN